jgi:glycosyltransferase involved in cell wall biosynthesis
VTSSPLVSILIPVYNGRQWVASAIDSALAQTWPHREIIVVDDGSTDGTLDVLARYSDRVRVERQSNGGQNVSRNRLTQWSRGDWLVYLDADDELAPDAVERKLEVSAAADAIFGTLSLQFYRGTELLRAEPVEARDYPDPIAAAFLWKYPNTSAFMFRRSAVIDAGGWNESIRSCTDYDLHFRLLLSGRRLVAAPRSVSVYRFWNQSRQASFEDAFRQTTTRLAVMWSAAEALDRTSRWTIESRDAFVNAAHGVIRVLYTVDRDRAIVEYDKLRRWNPRLRLAASTFSPTYRAAFRLLGFRGAERVAALTRTLRPRPLPVVTH